MSASGRTLSRGRQIPGTLVFNWQSANTDGTKPLIRRPITACEACRIAKVKCSGKRQCERCKSRDIRCTYVTTATSKDPTSLATRSQPSPVDESVAVPQTPELMSVDFLGGDLSGGAPAADDGSCQMASRYADWPPEAFINALEQFDWIFPDDGNADMTIAGDLNMTSSPLADAETPPSPLLSYGDIEIQSPDAASLLQKATDCQCRAKLMCQVPSLESVMQERPKPRLDKIFRVTGEIIAYCNSAVNCANCRIDPVDLVCILTVFQQTAYCFNQIARSGLDDNLKIDIGDYQVQLNDDPKFKSALVLNLVRQAADLLDALDSHGKSLFLATPSGGRKVPSRSPVCLNQLNLNYASEVIANFRKLFRLITNVFEGNEQ